MATRRKTKSIPRTTEAEITEDFAEWRGQETKDIFKMPNLNIGGTKAGGTLKEKGESYIQQKLDEWFGE